MEGVKEKTFSSPMISVIVPVYNVGKWLRECLDSIVMQNSDDYEVILVDDGSTDDSPDIVDEYVEKYNFFHVYTKPNGGLSSARNYGIDKAHGKYLYFLDSDDKFYDDKCISYMIKELKNKDIDVLYFDGESFFESKELEEQNPDYVTAYKRKGSYGVYESGALLFREFVEQQEYYPSVCLACYRKDYLKANELRFEEGYLYEDNLFTFKCMLMAGKVCHQSNKILSRRIRSGSITQERPKWKNLKGYLRAWLQMRRFWENNENSLAGEAVGIVVDSAKGGVINTWQKISAEEMKHETELSSYERHELDSILPKASKKASDGYIFPYGVIEGNTKLAIYGAGEVGKAFYQQAMNGEMVKVVAWVDANAGSAAKAEMPVMLPDVLKKMVFDVVLVAIENEEIAKKVRQNLIGMGIPNEKITWCGEYYQWNSTYKHIVYPSIRIMKQMINVNSGARKFWLFMLPEHGNMGDYAIGYAAKRFLRKYFPEIVTVDVSEGEWKGLSKQLKTCVKEKDVIFLNGGGDFGDLWTTGEVQRNIVEMFPANIIIFLPNTLTYKGRVAEDNKPLMNDMEYYGNRENVHLIFRERKSYDFCSRYLNNVYCYPDMVLSRAVPRSGKGEKHKALLCFRSDKERTFKGKEKVKKILSENNWTYEEMDIHKMKYVSQEVGEDVLKHIISELQSAEVVITDRLHGMILSVTNQVPCIAFDNKTGKISGVYGWLKQYPNAKIGEETQLSELMEWIEEVTAIPCAFQALDNEFDDMAETIKKIIG